MTIKFLANDKLYDSRIEAQKHSKNIRLIYNDHIYSRYNWKTEPEQSIDELYARRARQIREEYDYLILSYSGGADSHQILQSFITNNIKLDEVHSFYPHKMARKARGSEIPGLQLIQEYEGAILPRQNLFRYHGIKYYDWDLSDYVEQNFNDDRFITAKDNILVVAPLYYTLVCEGGREYINQHLERNKITGKVGFIIGIDKVRVTRTGDELAVVFNDFVLWKPINLIPKDNLFTDIVIFYWDDPDIVCKQAHLFKKAIECNPNLYKVFNNNTFKKIQESRFFKKLIYPSTFEPDIFQQLAKHTPNEERDIFNQYFGSAGGIVDDILKDIAIPNLSNIRTTLGKSVINTKKYPIGKLKPMIDRYLLEEVSS